MLIRKVFVVLITSFMLLALTNCCTTNSDLKEGSIKKIDNQAQRPPSPGNAEIKCKVEDLFENGNKTFCKIKVSSVLNYGAGTRPIGNGSVIEFEINNGNRSDLEQLLTNGKEAELLISEVPGGMGMENSTSYRIIKIIK